MNSLRDEQQLVEAVCQLPRPEFVADVELYTDLDSSGDPALRVWVIVKDADFAPAQQAALNASRQKKVRGIQPAP